MYSVIWMSETVLLVVVGVLFFVDVSGRSFKRINSIDVELKWSKTRVLASARGQALCPLSVSHSQPACRAHVSPRLPVYAGASPTSGPARLQPHVFPHTPGDLFLKMAHYLSFK